MKSRSTGVQNPQHILTATVCGHDSTLGQKITHFAQAKAVHGERRYCWNLIHPFGVNCLKASNDKGKQPKWDFLKIKKGVTAKNGCFEVSFSCLCVGEF